MKIFHVASGVWLWATIESVAPEDMKRLTPKRYSFRWNQLTGTDLYKLRLVGDADIKGVMSLVDYPDECRVEIKLLAVARENVILKGEKGKKLKEYDHIAGNLIAFAGRIAISRYSWRACVSLVPKTVLRAHYIAEYGMEDCGYQLFLESKSLYALINRYIP